MHNDLYGYLQLKSKSYNEKLFEIWLEEKGISKNKIWTKEINGSPLEPNNVTLMTYIRNHIHHPENATMLVENFTDDELRKSITLMSNLVREINDLENYISE